METHVGVDHVRTGDGFVWSLINSSTAPVSACNGLTRFDQRGIGEILLRGAGHEVHAHLGAAHHQGIPHVVPGVAHDTGFTPPANRRNAPNGEKVRKYLGGVEFVGQPVPDRHAGKLGKLLYDVWA